MRTALLIASLALGLSTSVGCRASKAKPLQANADQCLMTLDVKGMH